MTIYGESIFENYININPDELVFESVVLEFSIKDGLETIRKSIVAAFERLMKRINEMIDKLPEGKFKTILKKLFSRAKKGADIAKNVKSEEQAQELKKEVEEINQEVSETVEEAKEEIKKKKEYSDARKKDRKGARQARNAKKADDGNIMN